MNGGMSTGACILRFAIGLPLILGTEDGYGIHQRYYVSKMRDDDVSY
jgi:hypothetical protein